MGFRDGRERRTMTGNQSDDQIHHRVENEKLREDKNEVKVTAIRSQQGSTF